MSYSAWGSTWLGAWGDSWGPLHTVGDWDTAQGAARNLARNLARLATLDGEVRLRGVRGRASGTDFSATGDGRATLRGVRGAARAGKASAAAAGNGFAVWKGVRLRSAARATAAGNGFAVFGLPRNKSHGIRRAEVSADGAARLRGVRVFTTSVSSISAQGVVNPSDEEIMALMTILTNKKRRGINAPTFNGGTHGR